MRSLHFLLCSTTPPLPPPTENSVDALFRALLAHKGSVLSHDEAPLPLTASLPSTETTAHDGDDRNDHTASCSRFQRVEEVLFSSQSDYSQHLPPFLFTLGIMKRFPRAFFSEVLDRWRDAVRDEKSARTLFTAMSLREVQLLNSKLSDLSENAVALKPTHCGNSSNARDSTRDDYYDSGDMWSSTTPALLYKNVRDGNSLANMPDSCLKMDSHCLEPFQQYSIAHFAAELGSVELLRFAMEDLPDGIPMRVRADSPKISSAGLLVGDVRFGVASSPSRTPASTPSSSVLLLSSLQQPQGKCADYHPRERSFPCFDWVACMGVDHTGKYLSHLAAAEGNTDVLAVLAERYGAECVLRSQRQLPSATAVVTNDTTTSMSLKKQRGCCSGDEDVAVELGEGRRAADGSRNGNSAMLWRSDAYTISMSAVGTAIVVGQSRTLEWVFTHYPEMIAGMPLPEFCAALLAAALHDDDCVSAFEFLWSHGLFPPAAYSFPSASATSISPHGAQWDSRTCGAAALGISRCDVVIFAAAEAEHSRVVSWFVRTFGDEVVWMPDKDGATLLHHCARGGNVKLLRELLMLDLGDLEDARGQEGTASPSSSFTTASSALAQVELKDGSGDACLASSLMKRRAQVDCCDFQGRIPAVWAVLGGRRGKHVVDCLEALLEADSQWPFYKDGSGCDLLEIARGRHSPYSKVCRYLRREVRRAHH